MARPTRRPGNLPAEAASFIGRRRELAEVRKKLTQARLVTLVGPGGVGKTRLAVRAATDLARGFRAGGWLVELAEAGDPVLVGGAVLAALDLRDQAAAEPLALLLAYLRDLELLLVVDFHAEFVAGRRLGRDAAVAVALGQADPRAPANGADLLARREADVARLVADGLTNKQIGARLFISERTVDSHVRSILTKLGFSSRAQVAAWMARED
jgi:DNA-binding CsgD family transcriptional regulator